MNSHTEIPKTSVPWNKGRLVGQKAPLKLKEIWAIRIRLQLAGKVRDLALFNLAIDSKLRGCDLVSLRVLDIAQGNLVRAIPARIRSTLETENGAPCHNVATLLNAELLFGLSRQPFRHTATTAPGITSLGITELHSARLLCRALFTRRLQVVYGNAVFLHEIADLLNCAEQFVFALRRGLPLQLFDLSLNFSVGGHDSTHLI
jgi:hypothetical protein